ncbi:MAG: 6-bladed beta-propeller [Prevotellaceae bacterium]|nr:6-bladed beta-propeller [Prevotellaceae bacterium]
MNVRHFFQFCTLCILFAGFTACNNRRAGTSDYYVLPLDKYIADGNTQTTLNEIADRMQIIPVETSDSALFAALVVCGVVGDEVFFSDRDAVYAVQRESGKVRTVIDRKGEGPGYYPYFVSAFLEGDTLLRVRSMPGFYEYDLKGNFRNSFQIDSVANFIVTADKKRYAVFRPTLVKDAAIGIYDEDWNLLRKGLRNTHTKTSVYIEFPIAVFDNKYFFNVAYTDTVYQITEKRDIPYLVLQRGDYACKSDVFASGVVDFYNLNCIFSPFYTLIDNYCFLGYLYRGKYYYDIWKVDTGELLHRYIADDPDDRYMLPVRVNDIDMKVAFRYAKGSRLYCEISPDDVLKLFPTAPEDTNPMLLEIELKN